MQIHSSPESSSWCIWFLAALLTAGTIRTTAQVPAHSKFDRLVASAENGDAAAQVELGILYYNGMADSPRPDYAEALKWFQRAADLTRDIRLVFPELGDVDCECHVEGV